MSQGSEKSTSFIAVGIVALIAVLGAGALVSQLTAPEDEPFADSRPAVRRPTAATSRLRSDERATSSGKGAGDPRSGAASSGNGAASDARGTASSQPLRELLANGATEREAPPARPPRPRVETRREEVGAEEGGETGGAEQPIAEAPQQAAAAAAGDTITADFSTARIEKALGDVGVSAQALEHYRGRYDELTERTNQVRQQATREDWLNTPRFREEMEEIEADRLAIRDEVGDEAYDLVLFATGQTNRVQINNIDQPLSGAAGELQSGDIIISYDGVRIFSPAGLVIEMAAGTPGRSVPVTVLRQGNPMQINVPDGVLPIGLAVAQEPPDRLR